MTRLWRRGETFRLLSRSREAIHKDRKFKRTRQSGGYTEKWLGLLGQIFVFLRASPCRLRLSTVPAGPRTSPLIAATERQLDKVNCQISCEPHQAASGTEHSVATGRFQESKLH